MQIELVNFTDGKVRNLSGHERGLAAREFFSLDSLDDSEDMITVLVPEELDAIATSFFQGMFAASIQRLQGADGFRTHYRFSASPELLEQIDRGIRRVTMRRGATFAH